MNLKNRLLLGSGVGVATMCVIAVLSLVIMRAMEKSVLTVTEEYGELRLIDDAKSRIRDVRAAIVDGRLDNARAVLDGVSVVVGSFVGRQDEQLGADDEHHAGEIATGQRILGRLRELRGQLDPAGGGTGDTTAMLAAVNGIQADLSGLSAVADRVVQAALVAAGQRLSLAAMLLIAGCAAGTLLLFVVAYMQHRSIVSPIVALRDRMRAEIDRRAPAAPRQSDDVLHELGHTFDEILGELEELYGSLEKRIRVKSHELVQSERLASVGYLAAGIAHEINNPLSAILGHTELTLREIGSDNGASQAVASLSVVRDETMRCKHIVEKLLALVRKSDAPREVVDVGTIVREVMVTVEGLKQFRRRSIRIELPQGEPLAVFAREVELKQIMLNLIVNALEATSPGEGLVTVGAVRENGMICVRVRDNGHGMTPSSRERVFEPFFTQKGQGKQSGIGLGLSIVHAIVSDHGGTIEALSDGPGCGSVFVVRLPAQPQQETADGP